MKSTTPSPLVIKVSKAPRDTLVPKDPVEKLVIPAPRENKDLRVLLVLLVPSDKLDPLETRDLTATKDLLDAEVTLVMLVNADPVVNKETQENKVPKDPMEMEVPKELEVLPVQPETQVLLDLLVLMDLKDPEVSSDYQELMVSEVLRETQEERLSLTAQKLRTEVE